MSALENALEIALARAESVFKFTKYEQFINLISPEPDEATPYCTFTPPTKNEIPFKSISATTELVGMRVAL